MRLGPGRHIGFRRGPDTWVAKIRTRSGRYLLSLGNGLDFAEAKKQAEAWFDQVAAPTVRNVRRDTVRAALDAYLEDLRRHNRAAAADDALWRFKATVFADRITTIPLEKLTREDVLEWRDRISTGRSPRTVNRYTRAFVAALNRAHDRLGFAGNAEAWNVENVEDDEDYATAVFLTPEQRAAVIQNASPACADFLRGLEHTGARPGELARATVGDLRGDALVLRHRKGRGGKLRIRAVILSEDAAEFMHRLAADRPAKAPLFTEDDGETAWRRHRWARAIQAAAAAAKVAQCTAYCFRHARISELLQVYGVDPITVAQQTGTSVAMIERTYHAFIPNAMRQKLNELRAQGAK